MFGCRLLVRVYVCNLYTFATPLRASLSAQQRLMAQQNSANPAVPGSIPGVSEPKSPKVSGYIWGFPLNVQGVPPPPAGTSRSEWYKVHGRFANEGTTTPKRKPLTISQEMERMRQRMKDD